MNFNDNDILDGALKLTVIGVCALLLNKVANIFKGDDKKFSLKEFGRFIAFWLLSAGLVYIFYKNGNREHEWLQFDDTALFLTLGAWMGVLHLDDGLKVVVQLLDVLARLRSKTVITESVKDSTTKSITTEKKEEQL